MLNFWYSIYSSHRSRWDYLSKTEKIKLLHDFASQVFEEEVRVRLKGSRYWADKVEFDCVKNLTKNSIAVIEVKFTKLPAKEKENIEKTLFTKARESKLASQWEISATQAFDWSDYTILNKN